MYPLQARARLHDGVASIDKIVTGTPPDVAASTNYLFNGVRLCTRIMPARRAAGGGDWCETFALGENVVALSIGDVCGHGTAVLAAMVVIRQGVRDAAKRGLDPAKTLGEVNRVVCDLDPDLYATAVLAFLDTSQGTLTFANPGHPPPLIVGSSGSAFLSFGVGDLPLGVEAVLAPSLRAVKMEAGTLLVFYTDGVTEHERQPLRGEKQLSDAATDAHRGSMHPTAFAIERLMALDDSNHDDASILTAWTPRASLRREAGATSRLRHRRLRRYIADLQHPTSAPFPHR